MKSKFSETYICSNCEQIESKWVGKCKSCGEWNSFITKTENSLSKKKKIDKTKIQKLSSISLEKYSRIKTEVREFDKVIGGGIVPGSLTLFCGAPGVGKSTLVLKLLNNLIKNKSILYSSGEESSQQILRRTLRLRYNLSDMYISNDRCWQNLKDQIDVLKPEVLVIDSIQTLYSSEINSSHGSISQVKEVTSLIMSHVKEKNITCLVIGHVTKDGGIAGPKVLEHMVDTVLYFDKTDDGNNRYIRNVKNRFGSTDEVGFFKMSSYGLDEDSTIDQIVETKSTIGQACSFVKCGKRRLLTKIESLVIDNKNTSIKRTSKGLDNNRIVMLIAVVEKYLKIKYEFKDIYVKNDKYLKVDNSEIDLSIVASIFSSSVNKTIDSNIAFLGEISLTGEVKPITEIVQVLDSLEARGFKKVVLNKDKVDIKSNAIEVIDIDRIERLPSVI